MFLNIRIDWIILKTYDQQFTLTTKKSLHIIFKRLVTGWNWIFFWYHLTWSMFILDKGSLNGLFYVLQTSTVHKTDTNSTCTEKKQFQSACSWLKLLKHTANKSLNKLPSTLSTMVTIPTELIQKTTLLHGTLIITAHVLTITKQV